MQARKGSSIPHTSGQAETAFSQEIAGFLDHCRLSKRESDIVLAMIRNVTHSEEIGQLLGISTHTVNNHLKSIFEKTGTKSKTEILALFVSFAAETWALKQHLLRRTNVLVLDSDPATGEQLSKSLSEKGLRSFWLSDPFRVDEFVGKYPIDFIICSLELKGTDGISVLRNLRKTHPYSPQFILCTPAKQSQVAWSFEEALHEGASNVLLQPIDPDLLVKTLAAHVKELSGSVVDSENPGVSSVFIDQSHNGKEANIGFGGVFIALEDQAEILAQLGIGSIVDLKLSITLERNETFRARGQVLWKRSTESRGLRSGVGLRFVAMDEKDEQIFARYLQNRAISSYIPMGRVEDSGGKILDIPRRVPFTG